MSPFASSRLMWARLRPNAAALVVLVGLPIVALAGWGVGARDAGRWLQVLVLGWLLVGLMPAALLGRMERSVQARWKSLPVSTGEHWIGAYVALLPLSLIAGLLLTVGAGLFGPEPYHHPFLALVAAVSVATFVALGLAVAAWSDSDWTLTGLLSLVLLICLVPLFAGAPAWWSAIAPTGLAHEATAALTSPASGGVFALVKLVMALAAFTIAGILGESRA